MLNVDLYLPTISSGIYGVSRRGGSWNNSSFASCRLRTIWLVITFFDESNK